jgi:hypothetical protein
MPEGEWTPELVEKLRRIIHDPGPPWLQRMTPKQRQEFFHQEYLRAMERMRRDDDAPDP